MVAKFSTYFFSILGLLALLSACTSQKDSVETEIWAIDDFLELKDLSIDEDAAFLANYLQNINFIDVDGVLGDTPEAREKSQRWLIHSYSEDLVTRGIDYPKLLKVAGTDEDVPALIERIFRIQPDFSTEPLRFSDNLALSEITIIATVGSFVPNLQISGRPSGAYYLDVKQPLNNVLPKSPVALLDAYSAHDTSLHEGKECVFFLSPTLKEYRKAMSLFGRHPEEDWPENILEKAFIPYCTKGGDVFTQEGFVYTEEGVESLTRQEILALSKQE